MLFMLLNMAFMSSSMSTPDSTVSITRDNIYALADSLLGRFHNISAMVPYQDMGILFSEGLALLSAASAAQVDVMLESGTAGGQSAELMARFFEGTNVKVFTIDSDLMKYESSGGLLSQTSKRLSRFQNLKFFREDSFKQIPKLIRANRGKNIGVFVDGPKRVLAMRLCGIAISESRDVKFCAIHDVSPHWSRSIATEMENWERTVLLTYHNSWRERYGHLDKEFIDESAYRKMFASNTLLDQKKHLTFGPGLGIIFGGDVIPYGKAVGDPSPQTLSISRGRGRRGKVRG